jgi:hypothetical protein
MAFLKKLKKKTRDLRSQAQRQAQPATSMGNKFERMFGISRQLPRPMPNPLGGIMGGVDFLPGYGEFPLVNLDPDLNPPTSVSPPMRMPSRRPRRLPQIMPERMPSRFTGGGLGSFFERIFDQLEREDESPRLPMPEDMPRERFPMIRPGFAGGEEVNMDMMMADQGARQGISPAEQRMMMIQKTAADMGRNISDRDAQLFGMGEISFEEAMSRAKPNMDRVSGERNLMQQEQMFFPSGDNEETSRLQMQLANLQKQLNEDGANGDLQAIIKTTAQMDAIRKKMYDIQMEMARIKMINENPYSLPFDSDAKAAMTKFKKQNFAKGGEAFPDLTGDGKVTQADILKGRGVFQEGGAVESEIDEGLEELQGVAPEAMVIQQVMTMVMEMIQSGASEEQIVAALKEMGLDEEDIQQVMMMVAEQMQGQESIDGQLAQMM